MWSIQDGKKRLDITKIRSDFKVVSEDGLHLICPRKNMWDWEEEEKWLRSVVVDNDGFVVSCSWKKFGNYNEFKNDTDSLNNSLENNGTVRFSNKEDGSLCIRSVINGQVIMRTRGTLFGGVATQDQESFGDRFKKVAQEKYPVLLDPNFMVDRSLLFEYVAPSNVVVVRYKEDDLIFLGFVIHSDLRIGAWAELECLAKERNLNLVRLHNLPRNPLEILEEIKTWKEEGIVARCNNDQVLVKVKSAHYLANHRMKFSMNYPTMVEFIENSGVKTEQQLVEELQKCDYDWEIIECAKEFYQAYIIACKIKDDSIKKAQELYNEFEPKRFKGLDEAAVRKQYAMIACAQKGVIRPMMFCLYDGRLNRLHDLSRKVILSEGKKVKL
jgi:hypothetical protein